MIRKCFHLNIIEGVVTLEGGWRGGGGSLLSGVLKQHLEIDVTSDLESLLSSVSISWVSHHLEMKEFVFLKLAKWVYLVSHIVDQY